MTLSILRCKDFFESKKKGIVRIARLEKARAISFFYSLRNYTLKQKGVLLVLMFLIAFKVSVEASSLLTGKVSVDQLKAISLTIGGGLLGFTAIVFSLLLFSLQTNLQRLRYLDFYRFSADKKILGCLLSCITISFLVITTSLFIAESSSGQYTVLMLWAVVLFISLLFFSYKRSIQLINPIEQVELIASEAKANLEHWGKAIERTIRNTPPFVESLTYKNFNSQRWELCKSNPMHQQAVINSIDSLCAMTKVYTELNDYIVARNTLNKTVYIIDQYIQFRKNTFIQGSPYQRNSIESEPVFNHVLEKISYSASEAIKTNDKEWLDICFGVYSELAQVLSFYNEQHGYRLEQQIDYVIHYFISSVKDSTHLKNNDVMISASSAVGKLATRLLETASHDNIQPLDESLMLLGSLSIANRDITVIHDVMQRYGDIVFLLILNEDTKVKSTIQSISKSIHYLGKLYLNQGKMTSLTLGFVNGFYGFGEKSLSARLAKEASILSSDLDKYRSLATSLIKGICLWLNVTFNDRDNLYKLDQEMNLVLFQYLYSLSETMLKIMLELTDEKTDSQLRNEVYKLVDREIIALSEIKKDKEVLRRIDSYNFMNSLFNLHYLIKSSNTIYHLIDSILKVGFNAASINGNHELLVKSICASAIISVNNERTQYRDLIDKYLNEFSGNHKVFTNALLKLEYLGNLGRFENGKTISSYPCCAIEIFCIDYLTSELQEAIKYSVEKIKLNITDK